MPTLHDLADNWDWMRTARGFRVAGGSVVWEEAEYIGERIRIGRLVSIDATRPTVRVRYVRWKNANLAVTIIPR